MIFLLSLIFFAQSIDFEDHEPGFDHTTNEQKILFITSILSFFILVVIGNWWQPKQTYDDYDITVWDFD
jgi:hypothetical protein